jgi:hypothetical protein
VIFFRSANLALFDGAAWRLARFGAFALVRCEAGVGPRIACAIIIAGTVPLRTCNLVSPSLERGLGFSHAPKANRTLASMEQLPACRSALRELLHSPCVTISLAAKEKNAEVFDHDAMPAHSLLERIINEWLAWLAC